MGMKKNTYKRGTQHKIPVLLKAKKLSKYNTNGIVYLNDFVNAIIVKCMNFTFK
jgi:hypothetical protein